MDTQRTLAKIQIAKSINILRNYGDLDNYMRQSKSVLREQKQLRKEMRKQTTNADLDNKDVLVRSVSHIEKLP